MSDQVDTTTEQTSAEDTSVTENTVSEDKPQREEFPQDHPLVRALDAQKAEIKALKAKAKRLDDLEESQKSDAQKWADRVAKAEAEAATLPAKVTEALKGHLVEIHKIDEEDSELFLTATEPELLLKQVARLLDRPGKRQSKNHVPNEGNNPNATPSEEVTFARNLLGA